MRDPLAAIIVKQTGALLALAVLIVTVAESINWAIICHGVRKGY